ncbi:hypothetical protein CDAR_486381 [Caerostris darwini]|uniref:Uncharacterized protein n=1 Tax=Caerostris darwini TaxID=1538125 RepID=A0AAV4M9R9_9ARAC|nr:hypothetical protein CDAR_486381 [Caerostris darwini]
MNLTFFATTFSDFVENDATVGTSESALSPCFIFILLYPAGPAHRSLKPLSRRNRVRQAPLAMGCGRTCLHCSGTGVVVEGTEERTNPC